MLNWFRRQVPAPRTTEPDASQGPNPTRSRDPTSAEEKPSTTEAAPPRHEEVDHDVKNDPSDRDALREASAVEAVKDQSDFRLRGVPTKAVDVEVGESRDLAQDSPRPPGDLRAPAQEVEDVKAAGGAGLLDALAENAAVGRATAAVVCMANQKGGVGKTTTAISLAAALAEGGAGVLLVDLDPQGNATTGLGFRVDKGDPSTYEVLIDGMAIEDATRATELDGLELLPSGLDLAGAEIELVPLFARESRLRRALEGVRDRYQVVIVDCPPTLGLLTVNAMVAADLVLLPIQCEYYALEGVGQLMHTLDLVRKNLNESLRLGGVILTMHDGRTRLSQQVVAEVRRHFGTRVFRTVIPRNVRLSEAPSFGEPITTFDPASRGARAYFRLAGEFADRLGLQLRRMSPLDHGRGDEETFGSVSHGEGGATRDPDPLPATRAGSLETQGGGDGLEEARKVRAEGGGQAWGSDSGPTGPGSNRAPSTGGREQAGD